MGYNGIPEQSHAFLAGLRANNERAWFEAHRREYESAYVETGMGFVNAVADGLRTLDPSLLIEPKVLGSVNRINRDTRFSSDKRPYKDHLDIGFPHGPRKSAPSSLFFRVTPDGIGIGLGAHGFDRERLVAFRDAVVDPRRGEALLEAVRRVEAAGYPVNGEEYKRAPAGYAAADAQRERLLRFGALWTVMEDPDAPWIHSGELVERVLSHWRGMLPLHHWLVETFS